MNHLFPSKIEILIKHYVCIYWINQVKHKYSKLHDKTCISLVGLIITVHNTNEYKFKYPDNMWLPFIYQPQSDKVAFEIIPGEVYIF